MDHHHYLKYIFLKPNNFYYESTWTFKIKLSTCRPLDSLNMLVTLKEYSYYKEKNSCRTTSGGKTSYTFKMVTYRQNAIPLHPSENRKGLSFANWSRLMPARSTIWIPVRIYIVKRRPSMRIFLVVAPSVTSC